MRAPAPAYRGGVPKRDHTEQSNGTEGARDAATAWGMEAPNTARRDLYASRVGIEERGMTAPSATPVRIVTTDGIMGATIATTLGVVVGIALHSRGVGGNIIAGLDALGNGSALDEYRELLAAVRREALSRMAAEAEGLKANAVVGVRFDTAEAGREMVEVVAFGTAVVLRDA